MSFKRILVPVDYSEFSKKAVKISHELIEIHQAKARLIHVIDLAVLDEIHRFSGKSREELIDESMKKAQKLLEKFLEILPAETEISIRLGMPHEEILKEAEEFGADLIVIGKLGQRGLRSTLIGSVAQRVIEFSEIPVLVV